MGVRAPDDDGGEACLPASPVRADAIERVDPSSVPDGRGQVIVLVSEDGAVPVVSRSQVAGPA